MADSKLIASFKNNSFSGTDSLVFFLFPNEAPVLVGSISTVSYSSYRDKKAVFVIGKINVNGFTRGPRVIAGTMIFTLINQHFINDLKELPTIKQVLKTYVGDSGDISKVRMKADELPLFDIMIISASEYGRYVEMMIFGIDFTEEGGVLSVEDLFTENQFSFVARDFNSFEASDNMAKEYYNNNTKYYDNIDVAESSSWDWRTIEQEVTASIMPNFRAPVANVVLNNNILHVLNPNEDHFVINLFVVQDSPVKRELIINTSNKSVDISDMISSGARKVSYHDSLGRRYVWEV